MIQRLYVNPKLIELVLDECSFCRRFYLYEKGVGYELECFLNTLLEKRDTKFIGGQIELLQRKIESLQFIKMILEVYFFFIFLYFTSISPQYHPNFTLINLTQLTSRSEQMN